MNKPSVFINHSAGIDYPSPDFSFSPSTYYPEYPWKQQTIAKKENKIYDMVRESFYKLGLDVKNYGTKSWNPLKDIVKPEMNVIIKPNMVLSFDQTQKDPELKSLVSHPSIVRAVADYVYIALKGEGSITIADAPLQSCDFEVLKEKVGYNSMAKFYQKNAPFPVKLVDIRQYASKFKDGLLEPVEALSDPAGYSLVHMGKYSAHKDHRQLFRKYRVTNYDHRKMKKYHTLDDDIYIISNTILNSDLIISIPKLKTHRKAGMTCALKNFIGIIGHKDCLPHHSTGSKEEGGDEYLHKNIFKILDVKFTELLNIAMINKKSRYFPILLKIIGRLRYYANRTEKDNFHEGSWYGNDTIWRTTLDLVRIALYSDKDGKLHPKKQREIFTIVDGVVAGEREGPLEPTPKESGVIITGFNPACVDLAVSAIMGFDYQKIPTIYEAFKLKILPITKDKEGSVIVKSTNKKWHFKNPINISYKDSLKFIPTTGWANHIEKDEK